MLAPGDMAPDFALPLDTGASFRLSDHRGSPVVLFFYPQDDTEGCTKESLEFSALASQFEQRGAVLLGISPDTIESHQKFRSKYSLDIALAADPGRIAIELFGLWQLKSLYGREFMGLIRTSFVIGPDGRIVAVLRASRIAGHAQKVLDAVDTLP